MNKSTPHKPRVNLPLRTLKSIGDKMLTFLSGGSIRGNAVIKTCNHISNKKSYIPMEKDKKKQFDLQLNDQGFESFAATGWLGNRSNEVASAEQSRKSKATRKNSKSSDKHKRKTTIRIA